MRKGPPGCGLEGSTERVYSLPHSQIPNVIRDHSVQPADTVAARESDFASPPKVINAHTADQSTEFGDNISRTRNGACGRHRLDRGRHTQPSIITKNSIA